jgi:hypothetical protein
VGKSAVCFFKPGRQNMNYLGIDIAKAKLDCCLLLEGKRHKSKVVPNSEQA